MNKLKHTLLITAVLVFLVAGIAAAKTINLEDLLAQLGLIQKQINSLNAQNVSLKGVSAFSGCYLNNAATATPSIIITGTNGATTTSNTCDTYGKAKNLALLLTVGATSSRSAYWEYEWSYDGQTWFVENHSALQSNGSKEFSHGVATTTHSLGAFNSTTSVAVSIEKPLARYLRINFSSLNRTNFWGYVSRQEDQN